MTRRPRVAITMGDPVGIGPEICAKALQIPEVAALGELVVYGDSGPLWAASERELVVKDVSQLSADEYLPGRPCAASDRAQLAYLRAAFEDVAAGKVDAIVTAPISKAAMQRAGAPHYAHTELFAAWCDERWGGAPTPIMMLAGTRLRVIPVTTHVALAEVSSKLSRARIAHFIRQADVDLRRYFGLAQPRIAVAGLNPHAGEEGLYGKEDAEIIAPAVDDARRDGIDASGPWPGDTIFRHAADGRYDVVLGMYHDQALIPVKLLDFDRAVNVTLGLPMIRTSVDHGTAYDIAGQGRASATSLEAAIRLAVRMVQRSGRLDAAR